MSTSSEPPSTGCERSADPPTRHLNPSLDFATDIATEAGRCLAGLAGDRHLSYKDGREPVTEADRRSHELLCSRIAAAHPGHRILSEEGAPPEDLEGPLWIIDPLDGTANFARRHPFAAVSVAYAEDGVVRLGVVHAPFLGETFGAAKGQGTWCNGVPIAPSSPDGLRRSVVSTGFPHERSNQDALVRRVERLLGACEDLRRAACPSLDICFVGAGRLDAHTEDLRPWDVTAAGLIATEAGAVRSHLRPRSLSEDLEGAGYLVAAPRIHGALVELLR